MTPDKTTYEFSVSETKDGLACLEYVRRDFGRTLLGGREVETESEEAEQTFQFTMNQVDALETVVRRYADRKRSERSRPPALPKEGVFGPIPEFT